MARRNKTTALIVSARRFGCAGHWRPAAGSAK